MTVHLSRIAAANHTASDFAPGWHADVRATKNMLGRLKAVAHIELGLTKMPLPTPETQWCLVGNVGGVRPAPAIAEVPGTSHYSSGTKVYCLPAQWGDGYEKIVAIGKHRNSRVLSCLIMSSGGISNWRAQVVYSPAVLNAILEWCSVQGHCNWRSRAEIEEYVRDLSAIGPAASAA